MTAARGSLVVCAVLHVVGMVHDVAAQSIRGRASDVSTGGPIAYAEVALLDRDELPVVAVLSDSGGRFVLEAPGGGEYYVAMQRIGYMTVRSPLIAVTEGATYDLELEAAPEAVPLQGLDVFAGMQTTVNWLRRELGNHPNAMKGFRLLRGARLEEAKATSKDNTGMLRRLYIPVSHARRVCVLALFDACGQLYVNGRWIPNEHIDRIDMESISMVVTVREGGARVYLFTSDFDWKRHWNPPDRQ